MGVFNNSDFLWGETEKLCYTLDTMSYRRVQLELVTRAVL